MYTFALALALALTLFSPLTTSPSVSNTTLTFSLISLSFAITLSLIVTFRVTLVSYIQTYPVPKSRYIYICVCGVIQITNIQFLENNTLLLVAVSCLLGFLVTDFFKENNISEDSTTKHLKIPLGTVFSIVIPWAHNWQTEKMIRESLNKEGWGKILRVDIWPMVCEVEKHAYKKVIIHYETWNDQYLCCYNNPPCLRRVSIKEYLLNGWSKDSKYPEILYPYGHKGCWDIRALISLEQEYYDSGCHRFDESRAVKKIVSHITSLKKKWKKTLKSETKLFPNHNIEIVYLLYLEHIYYRKTERLSDNIDSIMHNEWLYYKMRCDIWQLNYDNQYCPDSPSLSSSPHYSHYDELDSE
jgi:hypothetical protein